MTDSNEDHPLNNEEPSARDIAFNSYQKIRSICHPLMDNYGINHFRYLKIFPDGSIVTLTTTANWQERLIKADYIRHFNGAELWTKKGTSFYLWDALKQDSWIKRVVEDASKNYNIAHGLLIIKRYDDYCECFNFATTRDNLEINNVYLEDKNVFERFILYFRDKADKLIKIAEKNPIQVPNSPFAKENVDISKETLALSTPYNKYKFITETPIKNIQLTGRYKNITLSIGEAQCIYLLTKNMTFKQIAKTLHISPRTVEARLNKARSKLNCQSKFELLSLIEKTDINDLISKAIHGQKID